MPYRKHKFGLRFPELLARFAFQRRPKITFIVPIYNKRKYIIECIRSILDQDVGLIEVICIDDASTDGSYELISAFAKDTRFIIARNSINLGPGPTRNRGIPLASASYVRFVDADDVLPKNSSKELIAAAQRFDVPLVRGNIQDLDEPSRLLSPVKNQGPRMFFKHKVLRRPWYFTSYLIRRSDLVASKAEFPHLRTGEDPVFLARLLCRLPSVATISEVVYRRRSRKSRDSDFNYSRSQVEDYIKHATLVRQVFLQNGYQICWRDYKSFFLRSAKHVLARSTLEPNELEELKKQLALV